MKKKNKQLTQLGILCGVLIVLVVVLLIARSANSAAEAKALEEASASDLLVPYASEMDTLVWTNPEGSETYVYDSDSLAWVWEEDPSFPLNSSYVQNMVGVLTDLTADVSMIDEEPLEVYGLAEPQYSITSSNAAGDSVTLYIGDAINGSYYARTDLDDTVYVIDTDVYDYLCYGLYDMATCETIPSVTSSNMTSLTFSGAVDTTLTERDVTLTEYEDEDDEEGTTTTEYHWFDEDGTDITDEPFESELISEVIAIVFDGMVEYDADDADLAAAGLDADSARILRVDYTDSEGEAQTFILSFGDDTPDGSSVYVRLNEGDMIYYISRDSVTYLLAVLDSGTSALTSSVEETADAAPAEELSVGADER